ncbi:MAG: KEOPS complex subunit Cgi121 [Candidatus Hadarchaeales archaeon]
MVAVVGGRAKGMSAQEVLERFSATREGTVVQLFDAKRVAGKEHLLHATNLALLSWERGERFAEDPSLDLLCWVAADRQIGTALKRVGITPETTALAVLVVGRDQASVESVVREVERYLERDDEVIGGEREELVGAFDLPAGTRAEEVEKLVKEKIALLELAK